MSNEFDQRVEELLRKEPRELALELAKLQLSLDAIDPVTKYIVNHMFLPWRFVLRDRTWMIGVLLHATFEPAEFIIYREADEKDYRKRKITHEKKYTKIKPGYLTYMECILEEQEKEWTEEY